MKKLNLDAWIRRFLESDPPRAKSITMTVFGDSIAPHGGAVWLGGLIALMANFGMNDRLVRTSVFRLTDEGWLSAQRSGRRSLYQLTKDGLQRFESAYRRIYAPPEMEWGGAWTLVFARPGELENAERLNLRKELEWEGYRMIATGVFCRPGGSAVALREILLRNEMDGKMFACTSRDLADVGNRPLQDLIRQGWELDSVQRSYRDFIAQFAPLAQILEVPHPVDAQHAFVVRTLLMHAFRRVQLHDPLLPHELLPADWPGNAAYELCRRIYHLTHANAERYLHDVLGLNGTAGKRASNVFQQRFGGLD